MKLVTFTGPSGVEIGAMLGDGRICAFERAARASGRPRPSWVGSMQRLIEAGEGALHEARELLARCPDAAIVDKSDYRLLAPVPRPVRMRDCNLFTDHFDAMLDRLAREESQKAADPERAFSELRAGKYRLADIFRTRVLYYTCDPMAVSGPDELIDWPSYSTYADFELEWAAVIGIGGRDITIEVARRHIFGFTIFNDWSARDEQMAVMPAGVGPCGGKDFDSSVGLGPCITTLDEIPDPYDVAMTARVNGERLTTISTRTMRHTFEEAIVQLSRGRSLYPGEIIGSGTALGGCMMEHGRRLQDRDTVELEVEHIGVLRNMIRLR